jgi:putative thioredoxin
MRTIFDVTEATFEKDVLERSFSTPVVVDFWAAWCGPCRTLGPMLELLAEEADGEWVLAKVDVDQNQMLAAQAGVQGIPAVRAFRDGRQVAEFVGALPEPQVRRWLEQLGPSPADVAFEEAQKLEADGSLAEAADAYRKVLNLEPSHARARAALASVELLLRAEDDDLDRLVREADAEPANVDVVTRAADALFLVGRVDEAFDRLIASVRMNADDQRDQARAHLLKLLDTLPPDDPRALQARKQLSLALF